MHLKKWLCMFVAVTAANAAFAGTTFSKTLLTPALPSKTIQAVASPNDATGKYPEKSQLEYLINGTFLVYEILPMVQPIDEETEPIVNTATALRAGLLAYEADVRSGRALTGNSKSIDEILQQIPGIFNKIQNTSDEVVDELIPVLEQLSNQIMAKQSKVNVNEIDQNVATQLLLLFSYQKAELEGVLMGRVSRIIQQEVQAIFGDMQ